MVPAGSPVPMELQGRSLRDLQLTAGLAKRWNRSRHRGLRPPDVLPGRATLPVVRSEASRHRSMAQFHHRLPQGRQASP